MRWRALMAGMIVGCGVAVEAGAFSVGSLPPVPPEEAPDVAVPASAPPLPADLVLPPHLTERLPGPPGWTPGAQGLPTLQDLGRVSPTYGELPPPRPRGHHSRGGRH